MSTPTRFRLFRIPLPELSIHFKTVNHTLIPMTKFNEEYSKAAAVAFAKIDIAVKGLHEYEDANEAIKCEGIFTGGGTLFTCDTIVQKIISAL
jgi:dipeptidase E